MKLESDGSIFGTGFILGSLITKGGRYFQVEPVIHLAAAFSAETDSPSTGQ